MKHTKNSWYKVVLVFLTLIGALSLAGCQSMARGMGMGPPMGSDEDIADSKAVWDALKKARLVGPRAEKAKLYMGTPPHGKVLELQDSKITVNGHSGLVIVKKNYGGPGVSPKSVGANRAKYLKAVTVMFKREKGYDADDKDWFWAKYKPDGSLHVKEKMGMDIQLAGRVAKGKKQGCISCHQGAPGGDFVFAKGIRVQ